MKTSGPPARPFQRLLGILMASVACSSLAASPHAEQLIEQGDAEVKSLRATAALSLFDQAAQVDPGDPEILLRVSQQCGNLIAEAGSPAEAQAYATRSLDDAEKAVNLAPDNPKAHLAVAVAYGRLTDLVDDRTKIEYSHYVKSEADKTLALDPNEDFAYHVLGRWNYGIATLSPVLRLLAKYIYGGLPEASLTEAARDYQKAIAIAPQRIIHHHELARVYVALGQMDQARKEWQTELTLAPEDHEGETDQEEARANLRQNP